jgi:hypothetical protein
MDRITISEHDSDAGSWRVASLEPEGALSSYVSGLYAYDKRGTSFHRRRELPDGSAVLIFNLGAELRVEHPRDTRRAFGEGHGFYSGASTTYVVTETDGAQAGAQIKYSLLGARLFLGLPLEEFGDALIDPSRAFGQPATELRDRLAETHSLNKKVEMLAQAAMAYRPKASRGSGASLARSRSGEKIHL